MFKRTNQILAPSLAPYGKLKQKIWTISAFLLFASSILVNVINVRTGSHLNGMSLLIINIPLIIPWGLAYLIAVRHRDLLKIFSPLYMTLVLLAITCSLTFNHFSPSNMERKFERELVNIQKDYEAFLNNMESSLKNPSQMYSADEYGLFAIYLNKFKALIERFKQEERAVMRALSKIEVYKIHTDEVIFNFLNIIKKKKELEAFSLFVIEAEKRIEDIHSECVAWGRALVEVERGALKAFATALCKSSEKKKCLRQECYRIQRDFVQEYIKFLSFLSQAYGNYEKVDGQIVFYDENDLQTARAHFDNIKKLVKEEEKARFDVLHQGG